MTWSIDAARNLIARCGQLRNDRRIEAVLRAEFQSRLRQVFPDPTDELWVNHYSEGAEAHTVIGTATGGVANRFIDTLIRSTVIEYEPDLRQPAGRDHGLEQVREYIAGALRAGGPVSQVRGILSDTVEWYVYEAELRAGVSPGACTAADITVHLIESFIPTGSDDHNAERLAVFLKRHLAREQSRPLSAKNIASDLGFESLAFGRHVDALLRLVTDGRAEDSSVALATNLWSRFVDGLERHDGDFRAQMYVDEVYVAILARLLAADVLERRALLTDDSELQQILSGEYFATRFRLKNMVEDDYFGWLLREPYLGRLLPVAREIQLDLYAYDFSRPADHDLFGRLMAQLARRSQRKLLGQEWTPSWLATALAARCLDSIPAGENPQVVDMCCGSGSIVAEVIKEYLKRAPTVVLGDLTKVATGFDIDPLAVMLAKTTWVVTLVDQVHDATSDVIIPIYHADSLFAATPVSANVPEPGHTADFVIALDGVEIRLPAELIGPELRGLFDDVVDWAYDEARAAVAAGGSGRITAERAAALVEGVAERRGNTLDPVLQARVAASTFALATRMAELAGANRNGIWAFILRNTYRPGLLAGQFNGLVSNPPWLAMSQLADNPYKTQLAARAQLYGINPAGASHLHLELATTYLLHAIDRYLKPHAAIACLLPGTVFNGHHHQKFRDGAYLAAPRPVPFELREAWEVAPGTFKVRSAAVIGAKQPSVEQVHSNPQGFHVRTDALVPVEFEVRHLGTRTAWVLAGNAAPLGAPTTDDVPPQGADLMPRTAVCVQVLDRRGAEWRVRAPATTSPLYFAVKDAKKLKGKAFQGFVAPRFLFRMVQSLNLLPFRCVEPFAPIALPARRGAAGQWEILDAAAIRTLGLWNTARRFETIDRSLAGARVQRPLAEKINERNKLTMQVFPQGQYMILNGAGGGISCGACLPVDSYPDIVVDQTLYWRLAASAGEAWYRVGLLNSDAISEAVRPFNPQGEFGARHLHTLPHRVIPAFDPANEDHREIARLAEQLATAANALIAEHADVRDLSGGIAARRRKLRTLLRQNANFDQLERLCAAVLGTTPGEPL